MKGPQKEVEAVLRLLLSSMYTAEASASLSSALLMPKGWKAFLGYMQLMENACVSPWRRS